MPQKTVAVFSLGGTISMTPNIDGGISPSLDADALIAAIPQLLGLATIHAKALANVASASLTFENLKTLVKAIQAAQADGADGIVVTQGTDTLEETAYALDLLIGSDIPVVVTGAMRGATQLGSDGPANLYAAVLVAISDEAKGLGTLVVMNDQIHAARFVRKAHTTSTAAFVSPDVGPMGQILESQIFFNWRVNRFPALDLPSSFDKRVGIITLGFGDDGEMVRLAVQGGYAGLVIAAVGAGHASALAAIQIEAAANSIPVILTSRVHAGRMLSATYNYPGSEMDLADKGIILVGRAAPNHCRILLAMLINSSSAKGEVIRLIAKMASFETSFQV